MDKYIIYFYIAAGGAFGALFRYVLSNWFQALFSTGFPLGTFVVNMSGAFLIGIAYSLAFEQSIVPSDLRLFGMVGFLGSFTTFSTFSLENVLLLREGNWKLFSANVGLSVVFGVLAVLAGRGLVNLVKGG